MDSQRKCSICKIPGHTKLKCKYKEKQSVFMSNECPICFNEIRQNSGFVYTDCNHSFCFNCFMKWNVENNTCPLCRKKISEEKPIHFIPIIEVEVIRIKIQLAYIFLGMISTLLYLNWYKHNLFFAVTNVHWNLPLL
mgnify:CR=1 FL=1